MILPCLYAPDCNSNNYEFNTNSSGTPDHNHILLQVIYPPSTHTHTHTHTHIVIVYFIMIVLFNIRFQVDKLYKEPSYTAY